MNKLLHLLNIASLHILTFMFWYESVKADVSWSVNKKPKSNKLSKVWQEQQLFRQNHHILFLYTFKVWNLKLCRIMIHCMLLDFKDGQNRFFSILDCILHTTGWIFSDSCDFHWGSFLYFPNLKLYLEVMSSGSLPNPMWDSSVIGPTGKGLI